MAVDLKKKLAALKAKAAAAKKESNGKVPKKGAFKEDKKAAAKVKGEVKKKGKKDYDPDKEELFGGMTEKEMKKIERTTNPRELDVSTRRYLPQINETCAILRQIEKLNEEVFCAVGTLLFDRTVAGELKWANQCLKANDMGLDFKGEVDQPVEKVLDVLYLAGFYVAEVQKKQIALAHQTSKAKAVVLAGKDSCKVAVAKV